MKPGTTASPKNSAPASSPRRILRILGIACATASLPTASPSGESTPTALQRWDFSAPVMATTFHIALYAAEEAPARRAAATAFTRAQQLQAIFSDYEPNSELNRLIRAAPDWQPASPPMLDLTQRALDLATATGGAFNPASGALSRLWRRTRTVRRLPPTDRLADSLSRIDWHQVEVDAPAHRLRLPTGLLLDYGGIAKGYTADEMLRLLHEAGFPRAIVRAGGDIRAGDPPPGMTGWEIKLQASADDPGTLIHLSNQAVSTSGGWHQSIEIDGRRYSHIVSPLTGLGLTQDVSCSVIAPDATHSDALATAFCVLGPEKGDALRQRLAADLSLRLRWVSHSSEGEIQSRWSPSPP
ncbi:MAG: FAD:protein FMN transferase [Verrucomicrobiales bacterium]|nr:FAD:protein FMN transferase [Verrucomicrobiales bacterium]